MTQRNLKELIRNAPDSMELSLTTALTLNSNPEFLRYWFARAAEACEKDRVESEPPEDNPCRPHS